MGAAAKIKKLAAKKERLAVRRCADITMVEQSQYRCRVLLSLVAVLLAMGIIFFFSSQTAEASGNTSGRLVRAVLNVIAPDFDLLPKAKQDTLHFTVTVAIRKLAHFAEFALLGFTLMQLICTIQRRRKIKAGWLFAWGIGTFYAMTDELHQIFVEGRGPGLWDIVIDSAGVLAGAAVLLLLQYFIRRREQSK